MVINNVNEKDLVKFQTVLEIIKDQFQAVMDTDPEFYGNYEFEIKNEQYFVPDDERSGHKIFIVVKFLPAEINFGQDVLPITIQATSECNGILAAQRLLFEYSQIFNLNTLTKDNKIIYQSYTAPNVISNFEVVYDGYRSLLVLSGTLLVSSNVNRIKLLYFDGETLGHGDPKFKYKTDLLVSTIDEKIYKWNKKTEKYEEYSGEEIEILNYTDTFDATPDTQPYFERKNFTESIIKYGTFSFNITSYLIKTPFNNKILKICSRIIDVNCNFYFKIKYDDEELSTPLLPYKLLNVTKQQNIGEFPSIVTAFTN